jgi:hypothetical protein
MRLRLLLHLQKTEGLCGGSSVFKISRLAADSRKACVRCWLLTTCCPFAMNWQARLCGLILGGGGPA